MMAKQSEVIIQVSVKQFLLKLAFVVASAPLLMISEPAHAETPFLPIAESVKSLAVQVPALASAGALRLTVLYAVGRKAEISVNETQIHLRKVAWLEDKPVAPGASVAISEVTLVKEGLHAPGNLVIFVVRNAATPLALPLWVNGDGSTPGFSDVLQQAVAAGRISLAKAAPAGWQGLEHGLMVRVMTLDELKALDAEQGAPKAVRVQL
jgi:hypothetical protein